MKERRQYYATEERRSLQPFSHEVGLQVPHRVHAQIQEEGDLREAQGRHREVHPPMLHVQRRGDHRGARDDRPHTHACTDTPEARRVELHGVPERQGAKVIENIVEEISRANPMLKGFDRRGLYRMMQFYETYKDNEIVSTLLSQIFLTTT